MEAFFSRSKSSDGKKSVASSSKEGRREPAPPWTEKYRPKTISDVVEQSDVVQVLTECLHGEDFPNLLLYGPPGTGKTSTILAASRQLFGKAYKERILELNASDERGIQVVRDKIKMFAQSTVGGSGQKSCPPFKIVILDEADSMTNAAQAALRRTMEKESQSTRFCLICNYISRIIEPLTSRCTKFRFKPLGEEKIVERLEQISQAEGLNVDKLVLTKIIQVANGDLRRAITCLQSVATLKGKGSAISGDDALEVIGIVPNKWLDDLLEVCKSKDYAKAESFVDNFMLEAYSTTQIIEQVNKKIVYSNEFSDKQKSLISAKIGDICYKLLEGGSEYVQLINLCCAIILAYEVN